MEENNNNLNETPVSETPNTDTTTNTPVSAFDAATTKSESTAPASDSTNTNSESNTPASAFGSANTNSEPNTPASAFGSTTINSEPSAPAASNVNPVATATPSAPSYYTSPGSNSTTSNAYAYNDTIITAADETSTGFGVASLIMGIISIFASCCCGLGIIFSILGIIFGCLQPKDAYGKKPGIAIAGIIVSSIAILFSIIVIIYFMVVGTVSNSMI